MKFKTLMKFVTFQKSRAACGFVCRLAAFMTSLLISFANADEIVERSGDWTVTDEEVVSNQHIRLDGSLILPDGAKLTLVDCTIEIIGDYSREHSVEWKGGTLITKNCTIGGFVNEGGTAIHTVFHLYDGLWEASDTTVSYSYGISFHWEKGKGVLRGNGLKAGPRPDAIILSGEADVELVDSDFPIGLGLYCNQGGKTSLDLMPSESVTATFDRDSLLPGVNWRLKMTNTRVERWFLFLRRIGGWQEPVEVSLGKSEDVIVSLFPHNLKGDVTLTNDLSEPLRIGNVTLRRADKVADQPAGISMYAMYLSGDDTDATIRGRTHICEWMQSGGTVSVSSLAEQDDMTFGCTTLELSGRAQLIANNVHFGRPLNWQPEKNIGEANVKGNAELTAMNVSINNMRFRTEANGQVNVRGFTQAGTLETKEEGGAVTLTEKTLSSVSKPKVWIYTDMSDPTLPGPNKEGTLNDPDDVSAMAGYLLMANEFETLGIVVASTHRSQHRETPNQAEWANRFFGDAYSADLPGLRKHFDDFPDDISFVESSIKSTAEKFAESKDYSSLADYPTVASLFDRASVLDEGQLINVLCWGSLTEPAILTAHCIATGRTDVLKRLRFIAHWTNSPLHQGTKEHPENVANCREDSSACAYMKRLAAAGKLTYYECGAIGQHGIVSGGPKGKEYFDQYPQQSPRHDLRRREIRTQRSRSLRLGDVLAAPRQVWGASQGHIRRWQK